MKSALRRGCGPSVSAGSPRPVASVRFHRHSVQRSILSSMTARPSAAATRCEPSQRSLQRLTASGVAAQEVVLDSNIAMPQFPAMATTQFAPDRKSFIQEDRIRGHEVQPDQLATIVTIANLLQEVAGNHAVGMWGRSESGFAALPGMQDLLFVMSRLQIRMHRYPRWGDVVRVRTYFMEDGRLSVRRDWEITDVATGAIIGNATSNWVNINTATRRLARLPEEVRQKYMKLCPPNTQHAIPPEETKRKLPDMDLPGQLQAPKQVARRHDMDMNGHINNVTYLAWTLESVPDVMYDTHKLYEVEIDFKAECMAGNMIEAHCNPLCPLDGTHLEGPVQLLHSLQRCDDNSCYELVRVRTSWK